MGKKWHYSALPIPEGFEFWRKDGGRVARLNIFKPKVLIWVFTRGTWKPYVRQVVNLGQMSGVVRWHIFKPKIPIWVYFWGPSNGKCWYIIWPFGILCGHLVYFIYDHLVYFSCFGMLHIHNKKNLATLFWRMDGWMEDTFKFFPKKKKKFEVQVLNFSSTPWKKVGSWRRTLLYF
jgi:hypothetical protein